MQGFSSSDLWNICSISIKEELLCRRVKILAFQLTVHIGPLKEGGKIKSLKQLFWASTELSEGANFWLFSRK